MRKFIYIERVEIFKYIREKINNLFSYTFITKDFNYGKGEIIFICCEV